jgi:RING finger protein 113A
MPGKNFRKRSRSNEDSGDETSVVVGQVSAPLARAADSKAPASTNTFSSSSAAGVASASLVRDLRGGSTTSNNGAPSAVGGGTEFNSGDAPVGLDGRSLLERKLALQETALAELAPGAVKLYRGSAGYASFTDVGRDAREVISAAKFAGTLGPARAPSNVRSISRMDFAPDICKDYKETGQCPFGDSCIFLHDRSEYKSSWKVEKEWAAAQKAKEERLAARLAAGGTIDDIDEEDAAAGGGEKAENKTPKACFICRGPFRSPVIAPCGHAACGSCAIERFKTHADCVICGKPTNGTFNAAPAKFLASLHAIGALATAAIDAEPEKTADEGDHVSSADNDDNDNNAGEGGWGIVS